MRQKNSHRWLSAMAGVRAEIQDLLMSEKKGLALG